MTPKVRELRGYKSLKALNAFNALMLGLKMLPAYAIEPYETFLARVSEMPPPDQEKLIREAVHFVELQRDEVEAVISFVEDANGIPYGPANLKDLTPKQIVDSVVAVCMEIGRLQINLVSEDEKKN